MPDPHPPLTASVVVITAGRRQCLPSCIESLRRQTYRPMEIVVIIGPSRDGTGSYADGLTDAKVYRVDRLNVAYARNEGIRRAGGDIIAFIDDDAVAHPRWLEELVGAFERGGPSCGGVGGMVVNENAPGRPIQALNNTIDDLGFPIETRIAPAGYNDPDGPEYNYFMGANMAFRREAILEAGGCDETYTYHYEDADLSVAVIRAGYRIVHHTRALVHHFPAISHNRRSTFDLNYFALARSHLYFSLKFSRRPALRCLMEVARAKSVWLQIYRQEVWGWRMTPLGAIRHTVTAVRGLASGLKHGLRHRRHGGTPVLTPGLPRPEFRPIPTAPTTAIRPVARRTLRVALVCSRFGHPSTGGVEGYSKDLAEVLAARGHDVTVLRTGGTPCSVRPVGYRIVDIPYHPDPVIGPAWFLYHLRQLADRRDFDIVEAPLFEGRGVAIGMAARWPLVVRLQTPLEVIRQTCGFELDAHVASIIASERLQTIYAAGVIGISRAVVDTVEQTYDIPMEAPGRRLAVFPLGIPGAGSLTRRPIEAPEHGGTRYLFVGRLEGRKGVMELARAFAGVAGRDPQASLWIVGSDNSASDGFAAKTGGDYPKAMKALWPDDVADRVHFFGRLDDEEKNDLYARCDVLVAPSRYESFGLIFLEAMRHGKPVIGTAVGGVPEVVADGVTGLLVPAEDPDRLAEAMLALGRSPELRRDMGAAGLRRFEESFSLYSLGRQTENFYRQVLEDFHGRSSHELPHAAADGTVPIHRLAGHWAA